MTAEELANAISGIVPVGVMHMWSSLTLPDSGKWMVRNGDILTIADYPELFSVIGNTFGGDGASNFALPDDRGLVERGIDLGRGHDPGRVFGSEQQDELKEHNHLIGYDGHGVTTGTYIGWYLRSENRNNPTTYTGGNETRMKNRAYLPIIKVLP